MRTERWNYLIFTQKEENSLLKVCSLLFKATGGFEPPIRELQFCASQKDYQEVSLAKLEQILRDNTDSIFTYTVEVTDYEETDEKTGKSRTIHHYEYTVEYAGDSYFSQNVFHLTDEQVQTADEYAANLHLFLSNTIYKVEINPDLRPGKTGNKAVRHIRYTGQDQDISRPDIIMFYTIKPHDYRNQTQAEKGKDVGYGNDLLFIF